MKKNKNEIKREKYFSKTKKGSILAYSLIIVSMIIAIAASLTVITTIEKKSSSATDFSVQSLQTADSGVQLAMKKINDNITSATATINSIFAPLSCVCNAGVCTITNPSGAGNGEYVLTFYYNNGGVETPVSNCAVVPPGAMALNKLTKIKSVANFRNTVRAVSVVLDSHDPCEGETYVDYPAPPDPNSKHYNLVVVGNQCWFKENLDYGHRINSPANQNANCLNVRKYCYGDLDANCADGALYQWNQATCGDDDSDPVACPGGKCKGICPTGFHVPSDADFAALETFLSTTPPCRDISTFMHDWDCDDAGADLKTGDFASTLEGYFDSSDGNFDEQGTYDRFWSSTLDDILYSSNPIFRGINNAHSNILRNSISQSDAYLVRCIRD